MGMVLRFHDELSIRQQFNAQKGAYKMAGTCFSGIKKPGETPGFYHQSDAVKAKN
ncbi:hypothetical protein YPPY72_4105 [Yersinia pestis PY-72]|uniref:Uncharacterized protein n=1 Tax=Yersinia pestis biovar Orientalis str. IP275 TaxID=373665 RepID=A0AAV3BDZ5_YERPE|nr:hypothetical protein YPIP275_0309 [Yersinia pestis biovar Orientalis str. IP275]EIS73552.1 hypothetical protein YPPY71_3851 [Yersinia pestis PY-71]EIS75154.1 hypothetical protein YPPY72_4105 [Yersinia pestis PY-72]EIS84154.1 hypothetical protein YPPY76_3861 [Yersinia pestis PY-76]